MGAYFQNQVISKDPDTGEVFTFVQQEDFLKFFETQYTHNITMSNIVRELSQKSSVDNPARVFTVCDYDSTLPESEVGYVQPWFSSSESGLSAYERDCKAVAIVGETDDGAILKEVLEKSRFLAPSLGYKPTKVAGEFTGFVVCKNTKEYLDIDKIKDLAGKIKEELKLSVINPISLLTRKTNEGMGGGDINGTKYIDELVDYLTKWYNKDIYWTSKRPDDLTDITDKVLFIRKPLKETVTTSLGDEIEMVVHHLVAVYGKEHSPNPDF